MKTSIENNIFCQTDPNINVKPGKHSKKSNPFQLFITYAAFISFSLFPIDLFSQTVEEAIELRKSIPEVKLSRTSAPDYCESSGGSTSFEKISSVSVVEKPGNLLDITVDVFIANPFNCESGEPCPSYDSSPEHVNVWIDWNGNKIWEAHEKVLNADLTGYQNINYGGTMTAKATIEIPPNANKPTWLRANLGWGYDPEDPCEKFWTYGNVIDQQVLGNVKVKKLEATLNIDVQDIPKPLWQAEYNETGQTINVISNFPLAAGMKNGWFTLPVELVSFPSSFGDEIKTDCKWEVVGTGVKGLAGITGKKGVISINLPQKIGKYELKLTFTFRNNQNNKIGEQIITLPLWVSYSIPQLSSIKKAWLEKAIEWTNGSVMSKNIENELASKIMDGIYSKSGWKYYYNTGPDLWAKLVEGLETKGGDCRTVATIWMNLLKTLGVGDASRVTNNRNFMVVSGFRAYGGLTSEYGNSTSNYHDYLQFLNTWDRWIFGSHTYGRKGNTFYDPTFNQTDTDEFFQVDYFLNNTDGKLVGESGAPVARSVGTFGDDGGFWSKWEYSLSASGNQILNKTVLVNGADFTGSFSEETLDANNDGIFDQLKVTAGVEVTSPANYIVSGVLKKDEKVITSLPSFASPSSWFERIGPQNGQSEVQALFSGENIFNEGTDGPYSIELFITDTSGALTDTITFNTSSYSYSDFGESTARIINVSESAADTNGNGLFDVISTEINLGVSLAGVYSIQTTLLHDNQQLITKNKNVDIDTGNTQIHQSIDTKLISLSGFDGPYLLSVQVISPDGEQAAIKNILTGSYTSDQFVSPIIKITTGLSDAGVDVNSNNLYDSLSVSLNVEAAEMGTYTILAWLMGDNGESITYAETKDIFEAGTGKVTLNFPGTEINKSGIDGNYKIGYVVIRDSSDLIFSNSDIYTTQSYTSSQFEEPQANIVSSTGNYSENYIDKDIDDLIDSLVIEIEVVPRDSGNVVALGRLVDPENETILWSSTIEFLQENNIQNLHLKFDGKYIYGGLTNGPYKLKDLQIYHVGDPSQTIDIEEPYTTQYYNYSDFEKSEVITGKITDSLGNPVQNAFLIVQGVDNDYSNTVGKYNLVLPDSGEYTVQISGPDTLDLNWSIYLEDNFIDMGDSVIVNVDSEQVVNLSFKAPVSITDINDKYSNQSIPTQFILRQNFPNPFNPLTRIEFTIPKGDYVRLRIYDVLGRLTDELINKYLPAGNYSINFNASELSSGVYYYRLSSGSFVQLKKAILLK